MNASKTRRALIASLAGALTLPGLLVAQDKPAGDGGEKVKIVLDVEAVPAK